MASIKPHLDMLRGSQDPWHSSGSETRPPPQPVLGQWLETSFSRPQGCHGNIAGGHFQLHGPPLRRPHWQAGQSYLPSSSALRAPPSLEMPLPSPPEGPHFPKDAPSGPWPPPIRLPTTHTSWAACTTLWPRRNLCVCAYPLNTLLPPGDLRKGEAALASFTGTAPSAERVGHRHLLRK